MSHLNILLEKTLTHYSKIHEHEANNKDGLYSLDSPCKYNRGPNWLDKCQNSALLTVLVGLKILLDE